MSVCAHTRGKHCAWCMLTRCTSREHMHVYTRTHQHTHTWLHTRACVSALTLLLSLAVAKARRGHGASEGPARPRPHGGRAGGSLSRLGAAAGGTEVRVPRSGPPLRPCSWSEKRASHLRPRLPGGRRGVGDNTQMPTLLRLAEPGSILLSSFSEMRLPDARDERVAAPGAGGTEALRRPGPGPSSGGDQEASPQDPEDLSTSGGRSEWSPPDSACGQVGSRPRWLRWEVGTASCRAHLWLSGGEVSAPSDRLRTPRVSSAL